ncbi:MAG TPA: sensor histidine kinase [Rectinemataceae bacterium]|nr:sensor histidine kinase [Rectinemataceae bacterium]
MGIDFRTIFIENSLILVALSLFPFLATSAEMRAHRYLGLWSLSFPVFLAGNLAVALRGPLPELVSILGSNLLLVAAYLLLVAGALAFKGRGLRPLVAVAVLLLTLLVQSYWSLVAPSTLARVVFFGSMGFVTNLVAALVLLGLPEGQGGKQGRSVLLGAFFLIFLSALAATRVLFSVLFGIGEDLLSAPLWDSALQILTAAAFVGLALSILFIHAARLDAGLEEAVRDREILLREMAHRTKNDLAIVDGLISLEQDSLPREGEAERLDRLRERIRCLASAHELLSVGTDLRRIRLDGYLGNLARALEPGGRIRIEVDFDPIEIDFPRAVPLGLVMNELVTNSLKHAFPGGRQGTIRLRLYSSGEELGLEISDDGVGTLWPPLHPGFGATVIASMVTKVGGRMEFHGGGGSAWKIRFPANEKGRPGPGSGEVTRRRLVHRQTEAGEEREDGTPSKEP